MDHLARRILYIEVNIWWFVHNLIRTQFHPLWYIKRLKQPFLGLTNSLEFNWLSRLIPHHMLQVKMVHFATTTVQQCQGLIFTTFGLFQKITHVHSWQRKIVSFCNLRKWKNQREIIVSYCNIVTIIVIFQLHTYLVVFI